MKPELRMKKDEISFYSPLQLVRDVANMPLIVVVGFAVIFAASFFNLVDLHAEKDKVGLDFQVMVKLAIIGVAGLYGAWGLVTQPRVYELFSSMPGILVSILVVLFGLAVPTAIDPVNALASTIALAAIVLAAVTALVHLGVLPVLKTIFVALACFNLGSWFVYFLVPSIGVFAEPITDGESIERMSGLAHPNTLGQFSGLTIVLGLILRFTYGLREKWRSLVILSAVVALVFSISRSSVMATAVALVVAYRPVLFNSKWNRYYLAAAFAGIIALMALSTVTDLGQVVESRLSSLSKSGEADELTSATGRSEIWAYSLRCIANRPVFGYGAASSKYILADYSSYTHNMVLNVALSAGVFAGLAVLLMIFYRVGQFYYRYHPIDGIVAFIVVNGLFENVTFSFLAGLPTIIWVASLILWRLHDDPAVSLQPEAAVPRRRSRGGGAGAIERQLV